jgi:hypothetical protein
MTSSIDRGHNRRYHLATKRARADGSGFLVSVIEGKSITISGYSSRYPDHALQDETGVNLRRYLVLRTTQELSHL